MVRCVADGSEAIIFYLSGFYGDDETTMVCAGPIVAMMVLMQWDGAAPVALC